MQLLHKFSTRFIDVFFHFSACTTDFFTNKIAVLDVSMYVFRRLQLEMQLEKGCCKLLKPKAAPAIKLVPRDCLVPFTYAK